MNNSRQIAPLPTANHLDGHQASAAPIDQDLYSLERTIAKLCYVVKQPIANNLHETVVMPKKPINEVLADNLKRAMTEQKLTQKSLSAATDVAQTTIGLYLSPDRRMRSASGKAPSAKLSEVELLATGLGVEVWELLQDQSTAAAKSKSSRKFGDMATLIANRIDKLPNDDVVRMKVFRGIAQILEEHEPRSSYPQSRTPSQPAKATPHRA
jgi:transcriptional regulator with XRE-family HTH domain